MEAKQDWNHITVKLLIWRDKIHQENPTYNDIITFKPTSNLQENQFILMQNEKPGLKKNETLKLSHFQLTANQVETRKHECPTAELFPPGLK